MRDITNHHYRLLSRKVTETTKTMGVVSEAVRRNSTQVLRIDQLYPTNC